jgi:hypothetical protein
MEFIALKGSIGDVQHFYLYYGAQVVQQRSALAQQRIFDACSLAMLFEQIIEGLNREGV